MVPVAESVPHITSKPGVSRLGLSPLPDYEDQAAPYLPECVELGFLEGRRPCVPGSSLPMERCYTQTTDAAGSGRGKTAGKRATAVLSSLRFRSPERDASASWLQSKTSAACVLESVTAMVN